MSGLEILSAVASKVLGLWSSGEPLAPDVSSTSQELANCLSRYPDPTIAAAVAEARERNLVTLLAGVLNDLQKEETYLGKLVREAAASVGSTHTSDNLEIWAGKTQEWGRVEGITRGNQVTVTANHGTAIGSGRDTNIGAPPAFIGRKRNKRTKILFLGANPPETQALRLDVETREIRRALWDGKLREQFSFDQRLAVQAVEIDRLLVGTGPEIVHFAGHGTPAGELLLEGPDGRWVAVDPPAFGQLFRALAGTIRCVVLNACFSQALAQVLVGHVGCVIGTPSAISDGAAISFSQGFYFGIAEGLDLRGAFHLGNAKIAFSKETGVRAEIASRSEESERFKF